MCQLLKYTNRPINCSCSRSSTASAMTWPRSTWTAWKSDSTNPQRLTPHWAEGVRPGPPQTTWTSWTPAPAPASLVHVSSSGCLSAMPDRNAVCHKRPKKRESSTGRLVTYYWRTPFFWLVFFCFSPFALGSNPYSFVPLYIRLNQRTR